MSGQEICADFSKAHTCLDVITLVANNLGVPAKAVFLLQGSRPLHHFVSVSELQMGGELTAIIDPLEHQIAEAKTTVLHAARQTLPTREQLALMEKIQHDLFTKSSLPLQCTYDRCLFLLNKRLEKETVIIPLQNSLREVHLRRETLVVPAQDETLQSATKAILSEIEMLKLFWSKMNKFGGAWFDAHLNEQKVKLAEEVKSLALPALVDRLYAELMENRRMRKKEQQIVKGGPWTNKGIKGELQELVNKELGRYSPWQTERNDDYDYYYCDCVFCSGPSVDTNFALEWRIDVDQTRWRRVEQARCRYANAQARHGKKVRAVERRVQKSKGGRFKPGERIAVSKEDA
jgi:hypothetical protein